MFSKKLILAAVLLTVPFAVNARDELDQLVRPHWPESFRTNGQLVDYLLEPFGFRFVTSTELASDIASSALRMMPDETVVVPLKDILRRMKQSNQVIVIDPTNRFLTFDTRENVGADQ